MKVLILLAVVALATAFDFPEQWEAWKTEHKKTYGTLAEEHERHAIWQANKKYVDEHNAKADIHGYTTALNSYSDLDPAEFSKMMNGYRMRPIGDVGRVHKANGSAVPSSVDWRTKGYVTGIKNQGQCGSCWAFSATGSLEGQHFKATGKLVSLSEQNLVDCSGSEGNMGCNGGLMDQAFEYIIKNGGIDTEASYPYKAEDERCRFKTADVGATCSGYTDVKSRDETALEDAVATIGPVSVAIDASHMSFQSYSGGVYYESACSQTQLDHGVLAVGYGSSNGQDYWIVKNSWGESWGMQGYIWMARNRDNNCGIATQASYPKV